MVRQEQIWNVIPLFILFREAIEASIIVSVLISFVRRMNARQLERQVWWGVGLASAVSIVFGIIFIVIYYVLSKNLFQGRSQMIFKACVSAVACLMITFLAFAMLRFMGWEAKWQRRLKLMAEKEARLKDKADAAEAGARISNDSGSGSGTGSADAKTAMDMDLTTPSLDVKMAMAMDSTTPSLDVKVAMAMDSATFSQEMQPAEPKYSKWDPRSWFGAARAKVPKRLGGTFNGEVATIEIDESELSWAAKNAFFIAVFLTVLREGLESVVFLAGVGNTIPTAIILPGIIGLLCGICFGVFLYYCGKTVKDIKWLFIGMAFVLFFIAAGQAEMFADWLLKAGAFGVPYMSGPLVVSTTGPAAAFGDGDEVYEVSGVEDGYRALDIRPWWMRELWDVSGCCADTDDKNKFLALARAIFGYNAKPAFVDVIAYCGYWVLVIAFACYKFEKRTLFDADFKHTQMKRAEAQAAADDAAIKTAASTTPAADATC